MHKEGTVHKLNLFSPRKASKFLTSQIPDPWEKKDRYNCLQGLKCIVTAFTLFPLRIIIFILFIIIAIFLSFIGTLGLSTPKKIEETKPMGKFRTFIRKLFRLNLRLGLFAFGIWWIKTHRLDKETKKEKFQIIVSNHVSFLDAFYMAHAYDVCPVAKSQVLAWPVIGRVARLFQPIPVARDSKDSKLQVKQEIHRRAQPGSGFPAVLVFPEGTRTNGRVLIMFRVGPFAPGVPVKPVCLKYPYKHLDVGNAGFLRLVRSMFEFANYLEVTSLPVYHPSEQEIVDPTLFASGVRAKIADVLNAPVTQHTYEDLFLVSSAHKAKISQDFEMSKISEIFQLSLHDVKALILKFRKIDKSKDGMLTIQDFSEAFGYGSNPPQHIERIFDILDHLQTGKVDFREFLYGLALLRDDASLEQKVSLAFQLYDLNGTGTLSKQVIREVMKIARSSGLLAKAVQTQPNSSTSSSNNNNNNNVNNAQVIIPADETTKVDELFDEFDEDKDGLINEEQFRSALMGGKYGELMEWPINLMRNTVLMSPRGEKVDTEVVV